MDSPIRQPLRKIAASVAGGKLDPEELARSALDAADAHAGLNIFTHLADPVEVGRSGPLAGVPYAAKDAIATKELPTCAGSPALNDWQASENAKAIDLLAEAGATLIGKANMHELSFGVTSNNTAFGPVRNPYDPDRIAGGSSGGSAAAVAVGAAAFALAADTGGSARIPAAMCGLTGFRPTTGRWPDAGLIKVSPTRDTIGAIVHSPEDASLLDGLLSGDQTDAPVPDAASLRIGVLTEPYFQDLDEEIEPVTERFVARLRDSGASVSMENGTDLERLEAECGFPIALHEARIEMTKLAGELGQDLASFVSAISSPDVREIATSLITAGEDSVYRQALDVTRPALQAAYASLFDKGLDAVILPAAPLAAARIGEDETVMLNGQPAPTFPTYARCTSPASVAGIPSVSIPIGCTARGLPVGLLVEAPAGADRRLLAIAATLSDLAEPVPAPPLPT